MATQALPGTSRSSAPLAWAGAGLLLLWLGMLLHEAGHALLGMLLYPPEAWRSGVAGWKRGLVIAAGPAVTLALLALACLLARRPRVGSSEGARWRLLGAVALGMAAASRLAVIAPSVAQGTFRGDEHVLARGLGLPVLLLLVPELLVSVCAVLWLGRRIPVGERVPALSGTLLGVSVGWASLFTLGHRLGLPI